MSTPDQQPTSILLVGSEKPGTGLSTASILLAEILNFELVEASLFRRKIVSHWSLWKMAHEDKFVSQDECWQHFVQHYQKKFFNNIPSLYDFLTLVDEKASDPDLKDFNDRAAAELIFDELPEKLVAHRLSLGTDREGFLISSKLAPIVDVLLESTFGINLIGRIIGRILLTATDETSDARVMKRENEIRTAINNSKSSDDGQPLPLLTLEQVHDLNQGRMKKDWLRYPQVFKGRNGQPLTRSELDENPEIDRADTSESTPEEVVATIVLLLTQKNPHLALTFWNKVTAYVERTETNNKTWDMLAGKIRTLIAA